jgi:hypothetical protein
VCTIWVFTRWGFYSIACANLPGTNRIDSETVMVRARVLKHLMNLKKRFPAIADAEILALPKRDYAFRIVIPKATWVQVLTGLAEEQTWSNFKDEAAARKGDTGREYVDKLHAVWQEMLQLQERG